MEILILLLVCGLIAGAITDSRGRGKGFGFWIGLLLGPLGIVLALFVKSDVGGVERQQLSSGDMRKCPYCAEVIKSEATVCRYCGHDLPAIDPLEPLIKFGRQFMRERPGQAGLTSLRRDLEKRQTDPSLIEQVMTELQRNPPPPLPPLPRAHPMLTVGCFVMLGLVIIGGLVLQATLP